MKPLIKKNIIGIMHYVKDLELAGQWYCEKLGFTIRECDYNDFVELVVDGQYVMHLFKSENLIPAEKAAFVFDTDDINEAYKTLSESNVELQPIQQHGDHAGFSFKDCDGNVLMICQYFNL
jgi:glyoxylase I family protein